MRGKHNLCQIGCERYQRTATSAASIVRGGVLTVRYPLGNSEFKTWPPANRIIASVAPEVTHSCCALIPLTQAQCGAQPKPRPEGAREGSRASGPGTGNVPCPDPLRQASSEGTPHRYFRCGAQSPGCPFFRFLALGTQRKEAVVRGWVSRKKASVRWTLGPANGLATDGKHRTCKREHGERSAAGPVLIKVSGVGSWLQ